MWCRERGSQLNYRFVILSEAKDLCNQLAGSNLYMWKGGAFAVGR
jgi:hypothetical protein